MITCRSSSICTFRHLWYKVYLAAPSSAPVEIGGLKTADPLDTRNFTGHGGNLKAKTLYSYIPGCRTFDPQNYGRNHADKRQYAGSVRWHHLEVL